MTIRIGFSMHPRWVERTGLEAFVLPLRQAGLTALEFELDDQRPGWEESKSLMGAAGELGLELSFHAPFRQPRSLVGFAGAQRARIQAADRPLYDLAEEWAVRQGGATLVLHAAVAMPPARPEDLQADTCAYLDWIAASWPHLHLAIENNHPPFQGEIKIGIEPADVLRLADCLPPDRLGICWDMGHDHLRHTTEISSAEWLARVCHVHVHDVDSADNDHYPLVFGNVPYHAWLHALRQAGMAGLVILELKGERMQGWTGERIFSTLAESVRSIAEAVA